MLSILILTVSGEAVVMAFVMIVVAALICWLLWWLIGYMGLPQPFDKVLRVIVAVVAVLFLINAILTLVGKPFITW